MYSEDSFKNYIFWIQVKRVFLMIVFSIIGALIGITLSDFVINVMLFETFYRIIIITISTLVFFAISLLITANIGKEVQEAYWKIAVLRKLTVISKKLDFLENLDSAQTTKEKNNNISKNENTESLEE